MSTDDGGREPPLTMTYAPPPKEPPAPDTEPSVPPPPAPSSAPSRNQLIAIGIGSAVALGALLGVAMGPTFSEPKAKPAAAEAPASDGQIQIQVTTRQAPPPKVAMNAGKIDAAGTVIQPAPAVATGYAPAPAEPRKAHRGLLGALAGIFGVDGDDRPREAERSAPAPRPAPPPPQNSRVVVLDPPPPQARPAVEVTDTRDAEPATYRGEPVAPRPAYVERPSFNCRYARSRAEQMVCDDPRLAAYDRRLARAFRRAVDNGVPYGRLRAQQDRWLAARERAAVSPAAVGMVYEQRIAELEDIGEQARQDGGDGW